LPTMPKETSIKRALKERRPRGSKVRRKKDPNAPKKNLTAFFFFSGEMRDQVKEENPGAKIGTISKILGQKWKEMDDDAKAPYVEKAVADKARYEKAVAAYKSKVNDAHHDEVEEDDEEDDE